MAKKSNKSSPKDKAKATKAPYLNLKKSKQGKMDILNPFSKILIYETESESETEEQSISDEHVSDDSDVEIIQRSSDSGSTLSLNQLLNDSVGTTGHNILVASLKNKGCLLGADLGEILTWKQGKGSKLLIGKPLKRFKKIKMQKMSLSQITRSGIHLAQMGKYLTSKAVHLNAYQEYVEMSSDITSHICWILANVAFMENIDHAAVLEYFNRRFADLRNRGNYVK